MADLVNLPIDKYGEVKLALDGGALKLQVGAQITIDQLLVLVENAIPGDVDNKLIDGLRAIIAKV